MWALQARRRLVVEQFTNYAEDQLKADVQGLATLLVVRLGKLHELYRTVDEQRAIRTSVLESQAIDATIQVEDVSAFLRDAVSASSEMSFGPLKIPVGILMSLFGRLVQGPRLIGSVHRNKEAFILTAQIVGGTYLFKWRVESLTAEQNAGELVEMAEELAYHIFTDIELQGSVRWQATLAFCEGLRAYRDCLRTPKDRVVNLQKAEKHFIKTLTEDTEYDSAYYNLGVVYTELEREEAAERAFDKAIAQNPNSWEAYYALALSRCTNKEYYRSEQFCWRVINLNPGTAAMAKAYQLLGVVQRNQKEQEEARRSYIKAMTLSWVALCSAALRKGDGTTEENTRVAQLETLASACLADLATMYNDQAEEYNRKLAELERDDTQNATTQNVSNAPGISEVERSSLRSKYEAKRSSLCSKAEKLLKQALSLQHADATYNASYHFQLGQTYYLQQLQQKYDDALHELRVATRINPDIAEYWALLALAYAHTPHPGDEDNAKKREKAHYQQFVLKTIIDFASEVQKEEYKRALKKAQHAFCILDPAGTTCKRIEEIEAFLDLAYFLEALCEAMVAEELDDLRARYKYYKESGYKSKDPEILALAELYLDKKLGIDELLQKLEVHQQQRKHEQLRYAAISLALGKLYLHSGRRDDCNTLIDELIPLLEQFNCKDREWEHGQLYRMAAELCCQAEQFERAAKYYRGAIEVLEDKYPREVRSRGLWSKLGNVLLKQQAYNKAWQTARDAIKREPLCRDNHKLLGDVYYAKGEFEQAIDAWQDALARENITMKRPHDPEIHLCLAQAYEHRLQQTVDEAQRQSLVSLIQTYCQQVRELDINEQYKQQVNELLQRLQEATVQK
jgi:tetratricopeptide (TPR) repeat protein